MASRWLYIQGENSVTRRCAVCVQNNVRILSNIDRFFSRINGPFSRVLWGSASVNPIRGFGQGKAMVYESNIAVQTDSVMNYRNLEGCMKYPGIENLGFQFLVFLTITQGAHCRLVKLVGISGLTSTRSGEEEIGWHGCFVGRTTSVVFVLILDLTP